MHACKHLELLFLHSFITKIFVVFSPDFFQLTVQSLGSFYGNTGAEADSEKRFT